MSQLSREERDTITQNPLADTCNTVRDALREAEQKLSSGSSGSDDSEDGPERPRLYIAAIGKLFSILSGCDVALSLSSRTGRDSLFSDLGVVRSRLRKGELAYKDFRPLSHLVIKQAPDADIWNAVINLIRAISHSTPPPSLPASSDTPITHSSASQQGSEQTRKRIEPRVFEEIRHCTHRGVENFHKKYFEGKKWNKRAQRIWQVAKRRYNNADKRWNDLSDTPTESDVCTWWLKFGSELLAEERAAYFQSTAKQKVGTEARRQLDLFVKSKIRGAVEGVHQWEHVLVVGELKQSDEKTKALWLQLGSAVRNVFASQPTRLFVPAFTLTGCEMETWVFDRSGPYSGPTFDIHKEPQKFVQILCGYVMMSDEELGIDTFIERKDDRWFVSIPTDGPRGKKRKLELEPEPIARQRAIVCRGTSCFLAKAMRDDRFESVVKFSWTSSMRPPEADLLRKANERGVKGLAKLIGHSEITSISDLRKHLVFSPPHKFRGIPRSANASFSQSMAPPSHSFSRFPGLSIASNESRKRRSIDEGSRASKRSRSNSQRAETADGEKAIAYAVEEPQGTSLVQLEQTPYDNRIFRALAISPAGRSISQFRSVNELLEGLRDAIKVHRSLLLDGKILHRDISENNIIITDPKKADGFSGMLIDLDLAKEDGQGPSGARHRTGTMEFMAIEVLLGISHTYRHDLEAFFYVLIWLCARRGWSLVEAKEPQPKRSMLSRWYTGGYDDIAQSKRGDMDKNGFEVILKEFPQMFGCVKPLCRKIRDVIFPFRDGLFTGTPQDPAMLYDPVITAFDESLTKLHLESSKAA